MNKKTIRSDAGRIALCVIASVILSLNISTFVHTGGLLPGGFSGLVLLLQDIFKKFAGITLPYGPLYIAANLIPAIISFRSIGKKFTIFSCITILITSVLTDFIPDYVITYDILLISIFGGIINGFATSLCLLARATSGGTDFIAIAISEKHHIDAFGYILIFNAALLTIDGIIFGWDKALYSIIFQFAATQVINLIYKRYKKNTLFIITQYPQEIAAAINSVTMHGATRITAYGTYDNAERQMIYSVVSTDELKAVLKEIKKLDSSAFVNVMRTDQIRGRFHMMPND